MSSSYNKVKETPQKKKDSTQKHAECDCKNPVVKGKRHAMIKQPMPPFTLKRSATLGKRLKHQS